MSIRTFLDLAGVYSMSASTLPFILGLCYSWFNFHSLNPYLSVILFLAAALFHMAINVLNNFSDYKNAVDKKEYREKTNIIGRENLSLEKVAGVLLTMTLVSAVLGIILVIKTGLPVLLMGLFAFFIGFLYSSGPKPLESLPLGEITSGPTMGFIITLLAVYVNNYSDFSWNWNTIGGIILIALPDTLWISNMMLANNICDVEEDEKNNRYTLPHYLGKAASVNLFITNNVIAFLAVVLSFFVKIAPWTMLLFVFTLPLIISNIKKFYAKQDKQKTFISSVKILNIGSLSQAVLFLIFIIFS